MYILSIIVGISKCKEFTMIVKFKCKYVMAQFRLNGVGDL